MSEVHGASVVSVNVGRPRIVQAGRRQVLTSIWKDPVPGRVAVTPLNLAGDQQSDLVNHGGPDKALYAYAVEDLDWWSEELHRPVTAGAFGENLTTRGVDLTGARIGDRWTVGSTVLEVAQPRVPCFKLALRFDDPALPRRYVAAVRPGAYLRVVVPGALGAGDAIGVTRVTGHDVTMGLVFTVFHRDHGLAHRLLDAPQLPAGWRQWAVQQVTGAEAAG
jgi:MOSC domain-containing protein YiiM